jgi:2-polyprenyl-3-methyl-5-hydroxy-6-metoxy-1,4-benzoquinol methylase
MADSVEPDRENQGGERGAAPEGAAIPKYTSFDDSPGSTHELVVSLVPPRARVLEFGCATGYMSEVLRAQLGCAVTGVEISPEAAAIAADHCDQVIVGDAEVLDYDDLLGEERFGAVLFADVLEHLRDPGALLRRVRPFISEEGVVVASVPNVAHASVRLALLGGEFRYRDTGLLDDTHIRFYTRESIQDLFEGSGYAITDWLRRRVGLSDAEIQIPPHLPENARAWAANADPEATTYQFVLRAVRSGDARELAARRHTARRSLDEAAALRQELAHERAMVAELRQELERVGTTNEEERAKLEDLRRAHEALSRRLVAERAAFADGIARVQASVYGSRSWRYTAPLRRAIRTLSRVKP